MINTNFLANKWVIIAIVASLILIFFMGKSYGKSIPPEDINVDDLVDDTGYLVSTLSDSDIQFLTTRIFKDIEGVNFWFGSHAGELWYEISNLSDRDLTRVSNYWNNKYYKEHKETLSEAIDSDFFGSLNSIAKSLVRRLQRIENL